MVHEQLENLVRIGRLKAEAPAPAEITGLVRSGLARLKDAKLDHLSIESRFDLAYNAAHALSLAALRIAGYRAQSRYIVFQCLRHTLDFPNENWRVLDLAHRRRNLSEYEGDLELEESLVEALIRAVEEVASRLSQYHPENPPFHES